MFGRCGASAHRCRGLQLLHIVRGGGNHTHRGTNGHREPAACDLESGTVPLQHMSWCMVLGCGAKVTFGRWWKGPRAAVPIKPHSAAGGRGRGSSVPIVKPHWAAGGRGRGPSVPI